MVVVRPIDEKANESLHARSDEQTVNVREVVAHQERRSPKRHVLLTDDSNPVDGVREQPQTESHQELWNDAEHIEAGQQRHDAEHDEDPIRRQLELARCRATATPDANMIATMFRKLLVAISRPFSWPPLRCCSSAVQRDREQTAEEPDQREIDRGQRERVTRARERDREDAHADRANRCEPELDLVAGQPTRREASDADANRRERGQHADPRVAQRHHVGAEQDDDELQQ